MPRVRTSGIIALGAGATILLSFVTQWFILTRLGASRVTDAYFAALAVPVVLLYVFGDPLNRIALPMLSVRRNAEFWTFAWTTLQVSCLFFLATAALLLLTVGRWIPLLVPGFSSSAVAQTTSLARILVFGMACQGVSIAARAVWNGGSRFIWPSLASAIAAGCGLAILVATLRRFGVSAAAWAFDARFGIECLFLVVPLGNYSLPRWSDVGPFVRKARPLIVGAAYFRTDVLVDRVLTSLAPAGGLSLLYLAQQLLSAIGQVINQSVVTPSIPALATAAHASQWDEFAKTARGGVRNLLALGVAMLVGFLLLGRPALSLIFAHQAMGAHEIGRLALLILSLTGMLLLDGVVYFVYSAFYSAGDTMTPTVATAAVYSVSVAVKVAAFMMTGIVGLAVAISAYYVSNALVLLFLLHGKLRRDRTAGGFRVVGDATIPVAALGSPALVTTTSVEPG